MSSSTWDPNSTSLPLLKDLPSIPGAPPSASWFWGKDDFLGRLNLLTPTRVKTASSQIQTGEIARMDLPANIPKTPAFGRQKFHQEIRPLRKDYAYDDVYHMNTQSGTQWDGFRHVAHPETGYFYNWTRGADIDGEKPNEKASIHYWSQHGFAGRGVLLDYRSWATSIGRHYDSATAHAITYADLEAVGKFQGIDIRPASKGGDIQIGDILFVRAGYTQDYHTRTSSQNAALGLRDFKPAGQGTDSEIQSWAGLSQEYAIREWLHDCYFTAVGGDSPTFEKFPPPSDGTGLHPFLLACWGCPIGEMVDLEKVSELAKKNGKWTFFFTSATANVVRGVASHVNGTAIF